eukprot:1702009-Pyramimonas_sp.AAC.1
MEATGSADGKWEVFVYQAEWHFADALGLLREFEPRAGRAGGPRLEMAKVTALGPPRLPRVSVGAMWLKSMALAFEGAVQIEVAFRRHQACRAIEKLNA